MNNHVHFSKPLRFFVHVCVNQMPQLMLCVCIFLLFLPLSSVLYIVCYTHIIPSIYMYMYMHMYMYNIL